MGKVHSASRRACIMTCKNNSENRNGSHPFWINRHGELKNTLVNYTSTTWRAEGPYIYIYMYHAMSCEAL